MYADERTGEIALTIHAIPPETEAYEAEVPRLRALLGHPIRLEFHSAPTCELTCPDETQPEPSRPSEAAEQV